MGYDESIRGARLFCRTLTSVVFEPALKVARSHEVTEAQLDCLRYIAGRKDCTSGDVARGLRISPAAATNLVDRLVKKGLVNRQEDPEDRRIVLLSLTPSGSETFEEITRSEDENFEEILSRLQPRHRDLLLQALTAFVKAGAMEEAVAQKICLECGKWHQPDCPLAGSYSG
ncbi:MAG: MarR family winged helix-turn-helix transcriptional regulator [Syntrophothermus sp.]